MPADPLYNVPAQLSQAAWSYSHDFKKDALEHAISAAAWAIKAAEFYAAEHATWAEEFARRIAELANKKPG